MPTDTKVNDLKINVLSEAQYEQIQSPSATELYLVPETVDTTPTSGSTNPITSGGVYNALQNIPAQEQSDWSESDNTDPAYIKNKPTLGTAAAKNVPSSGDAATTEVVMGDDTRLSDARTPTSHTHGNITNDGKVGSASGKILTTGTGGAVQASDSITKSMISDFPALAAVATSGSYNDLSNTPTIPTVPTHRTINHEQITDSTLGDANLHDGFYFPNAVQDYDGNWYGAVVIGDQVWLGENLRTTHLANGTVITKATTQESENTAYYYDVSESTFNLRERGLLYNFTAANNSFINNFHLPSKSEYIVLSNYVSSQKRYILSDVTSRTAKSLSSTHGWSTSTVDDAVGNEQNANNKTGFGCIPVGYFAGGVLFKNSRASFWNSTVYSTAGRHCAVLASYDRSSFDFNNYFADWRALSIRLVSDLTPIQFRDWYVKTYGTMQHNIHPMEELSDVKYEWEAKYIPNALTDYDGNSYGAVILGDQVWMAENLRTTHYADGTAISSGIVTTAPTGFTTKESGYYYLIAAVMNGASSSTANPSGVQGISPTGWHVPSKAEFTQLQNYLSSDSKYYVGGNSDYTGKSMASTYGWAASSTEYDIGYNQSENNASGLNFIPVGAYVNGAFNSVGSIAVFHNSYKPTTGNLNPFLLNYNTKEGSLDTNYGPGVWHLSVRCVYNGTPEQFIRMLMDKQVLVYDYSKQAWVNKNVAEALPSMNGNSGKVLSVNSTETDVEWVSTQECMWYGVRKDRSNDSTTLERIGNLEMHKTLPIQSKMRRCLLLDNGTVNYYLSDTDSTKKEDGVTAAVLDGTDGQVMVEIPAHYQRFDIYTDEVTGHEIEERKISEVALPGFEYVPVRYYSAFEAALDRTNNKLSSVINTSAQYRGGDNMSSWDGTYRSLLGMPATNKSLTNFRTYARNRGSRWTCHDNNIYEDVCNLYYIEYANTNCQLAFNNTLTTEGYKQGGLGMGVTEMPSWSNYNANKPIIPCGVTKTLGNFTGIVSHNVMASDGTTVNYAAPVPSYRGIENLFGHVWKYTDGILLNAQTANNGGKSMVYKCIDPNKYSSSITSDYKYIGNSSRSNGFIKNILTPCMIASEVGATSSTGYADYYQTSIPTSATTVLAVFYGGGSASYSNAGISIADTTVVPTYIGMSSGTRLCYTPMTVELPPLEGNSGKVLAVNSGETGVEWARPVTVYSGSSEPSASLGEDGDIYILAS